MTRKIIALFALMLIVTVTAQAQDAAATGTRTFSGTRNTPRGPVTYEKNVTHSGEGVTNVTGTTTGPNGEVRHFTNTITKTGEGQWTGVRNVTGANGETRTINTNGQRTDNGWQKTQSWTGKDGTAKTRQINVTKNGDGTATRNVTGANGQTRTRTIQHPRRAR